MLLFAHQVVQEHVTCCQDLGCTADHQTLICDLLRTSFPFPVLDAIDG